MSSVAEYAAKTKGGHFTHEIYSKLGLLPPQLAVSRKNRRRMYVEGQYNKMVHPLPYAHMWRGNHDKYQYNKHMSGHFGESETKKMYHQYYSHAKDPTQYGRSGLQTEMLLVSRGKLKFKPLPAVQYVDPKSKPKFNYKSWHDALDSREVWQREVQYPEHVPAHLGAKRPLAIQSPSTLHNFVHLAHMEKIVVTICPFLFGFGRHLQKAVLDFYRRCLGARSPFPADKIELFYTIDYVSPKVEVFWLDGSSFDVPLLEGARDLDIVQLVMEQSWLAADRMDAAGRQLQPLPIDDYKWQQVLNFKKKKKAEADKGKK